MRKLLLISLGALATLGLQARQLTPAEALTRAVGNESRAYATPSRSGEVITPTYTSVDNATGQPGLYVFNRQADSGFVVVSADDTAMPLLGYADNGSFDSDNMPKNLKAWLQEYTNQVIWSSTVAAGYQQAASSVSSRPSRAAISPLCTTKWNQLSPYNDLCPLYKNERSATGCVATAMAQVMKYHNYPTNGLGSVSYTTGEFKLSVNFNFANTTFDWANMLDTYTSSSSSASKNAVATLMYAAGAASQMDYTPESSGAIPQNAAIGLVKYFNYDKGLTLQWRDWYGLYEWEDMIYNDIKTNGPVLLGGSSVDGGHAFVCDGYDKDGYFHINWGWGGMSDGYFLLTALDPDNQGVGGSSSGYNFDQDAFIGLRKPVSGSTYVSLMALDGDFSGTSTSKYNATFSGLVYNAGIATVEKVYLGVQVGDKFYQMRGSSKNFDPGYGSSAIQVSLSGLAAGTYTVRPAYKVGSEDWKLTKVSLSNVNSLTMTVASDGTITFSKSTDTSSLKITDIAAQTPLSPGKMYRITAKATNNGSLEYYNTVYPVLYSGNTVALVLSQNALDVPVGETVDITVIDQLPSSFPVGSYTLAFATLDGSTYTKISDEVTVQVSSTASPVLKVTSLTIDDAGNVDKNNMTVRAKITNTGGYFYDELAAVIYPYGGSGTIYSVGEIYQNVDIPADVTDYEVVLTGSFPEGEIGKEYFVVLYNGSSEIYDQYPRFTIGDRSAIYEVAADSQVTATEIYTTSGMKLCANDTEMLPSGIYIIVETYTDGHRTSRKYLKK